MRDVQRIHRILAACGLGFIIGLLLACGTGIPLGSAPRWACPSPTPLPYGPNGPVKELIPLPTATPSGSQEYKEIYYEEWEQEYGQGGTLIGSHPPFNGPPFPSPTPYSIRGTSYALGQRVNVGQMHVMVGASGGSIVSYPGIAPNTQQLYYVDVTWYNHAVEAIPINYAHDVRVRAVTAPNSAIVTDSNWGMSDRALEISGQTPPPKSIPTGESKVRIPVIAPIGEVKTVEVVFVGQPGYSPLLPTFLPGTPTVTPIIATPTPNTDLRNTTPTYLTIQWSDTAIGIGPSCNDPGAMTSWEGAGWGSNMPVALAAPPGASRVVQIALNQVGKRYIWGAKGPETFDCSGLMTWSYARIGLDIPHGTAGQWPRMRPVSGGEIQSGDLVFFTVESPGRIDHVGMLIGDQDGDGKWDMVHASAPCCGVRVEYDILNRPFWMSKIAGFRTAR